MNRRQMKKQAKALLKPQFVTVLLTIIISGLIVGMLEFLPVSSSVTRMIPNGEKAISISLSVQSNRFSTFGSIVGLILGGPLGVGAMMIYSTVTSGQKAQLEQLFTPFKTQFVTSFLANLVSGLVIALYTLLLIIPGIVKGYSYAMVFYVLGKEPQLSAMDALHRSQELMKGHRMELFALHLSFIGWYILCVLTFGIAAIWVGPYVQITETVFFDKVYGAAE